MRLRDLLLAGLLLASYASAQGKTRTRAEVDALIAKEGRKPPRWWRKTRLRYPKSLDLSWPANPQGPWNASKNVGQYIWSVINENPPKWNEGVRFLHHLLELHKDDKDVLTRAMTALGNAYHNLHEDWARAAFWWRKAGKTRGVGVANCYWKLGCKEMAVEVLEGLGGYDGTRHCTVIKLWADMGEFEKALEMADRRGGDAGFLAGGDACRLAGRYDDAIRYYEKVLLLPGEEGDRDRNRNRAQASIEAVRLFDALDLKRVRAGKYRAQSLGYEAPVHVEVRVSRRKIRSVTVTRHREKQFYSSIADTPRRIILKQGVKGVEATSGATITSEAIINAAAKALDQGLKKKKK